jgi:cob(I)alamin adenosyltransferase
MSFANRAPEQWGMISVYTGDGKGKTTAALGTAIRALAKGKRVAIVYFDKGGTTHYSERELPLGIDLHPTGLDRIDPKSGRFRFGVMPEDIAEAKRGLAIVEKLFTDSSHDLVVLDEVNSTTALGMLVEQEVVDMMKKKPATMELIMTGRNAPQSFLDLANLVTEMKLVKHYFYNGVGAREGIDY